MSTTSGLTSFHLQAGDLSAEVLPFGGHLIQLDVPDRAGNSNSVVMSLPDTADYLDRSLNPYLGAVIGRWANRIGGARFPLDYTPIEVVPNEGPHQLHGGPEGFDRRVWDVVDHSTDRITLRLISPAGDQGFPATVEAFAHYVLEPGEAGNSGVMELTLTATADGSTPVNMTTHTYWNLSGSAATSVEDHRLTVPAEWSVDVDASLLPSGRLPSVEGTEWDLRHGPRLGDVLDATGGLDRCFLLTHDIGREIPGLRIAAHLEDPESGRALTVSTNQPGVQVYVPDGPVAGRPNRGGVCLETGALPDALNRPGFKPKTLRPRGEYRHIHRVEFGYC